MMQREERALGRFAKPMRGMFLTGMEHTQVDVPFSHSSHSVSSCPSGVAMG
jgi:hypothetical protein